MAQADGLCGGRLFLTDVTGLCPPGYSHLCSAAVAPHAHSASGRSGPASRGRLEEGVFAGRMTADAGVPPEWKETMLWPGKHDSDSLAFRRNAGKHTTVSWEVSGHSRCFSRNNAHSAQPCQLGFPTLQNSSVRRAKWMFRYGRLRQRHCLILGRGLHEAHRSAIVRRRPLPSSPRAGLKPVAARAIGALSTMASSAARAARRWSEMRTERSASTT